MRPSEVRLEEHGPLASTFGKRELENSVALIVYTLSKRGDEWRGVDAEEIEDTCRSSGPFNILVQQSYWRTDLDTLVAYEWARLDHGLFFLSDFAIARLEKRQIGILKGEVEELRKQIVDRASDLRHTHQLRDGGQYESECYATVQESAGKLAEMVIGHIGSSEHNVFELVEKALDAMTVEISRRMVVGAPPEYLLREARAVGLESVKKILGSKSNSERLARKGSG